MYCEHCGTRIPEGSAFCLKCGAEQHGGKVPLNHDDFNMSDEKYKEAWVRKVSERGRNMTIASLILGIISVCFGGLSIIAICCGIAGIWCSIVAKKNGSGGGLYIAGFVTSIVGIVIGGVGLITLLMGLSILNSIFQSIFQSIF